MLIKYTVKISFVLLAVTINQSSADDYALLLHGYSTKTDHSYIRTTQAILNEEDQMLTMNKPHKVNDEMVKSANPLTSTSH